MRLTESIQLVSALTTHVAETHGVRVLLIKGPAATAMGVRAARPSINVDLWVEPVCFSYFLTLLEGHGWHRINIASNGSRDADTVALGHVRWLCTVAAHRAVPGFRASPEVAFDAVWDLRDYVTLGTSQSPVPDVVGAAAISVLNAAGRRDDLPETLEDVDLALDRVTRFTPEQAEALRELARVTRSTDALKPLLGALDHGPRDEL